MFRLWLIIGLFLPMLVWGRVQSQKVNSQVSLDVDDTQWSIVESEKLFRSKIPILFSRKFQEIFGPIFTAPLEGYATSRALEDIHKDECLGPDFKTQYVSVEKNKRIICDITFSQDGKDYRQLWIIDRVGVAAESSFHKTIISFTAGKESSDELNTAVDGLKRSIAGSK